MYVLGGVNPVDWTASTQFILCISRSRHKARGGDGAHMPQREGTGWSEGKTIAHELM